MRVVWVCGKEGGAQPDCPAAGGGIRAAYSAKDTAGTPREGQREGHLLQARNSHVLQGTRQACKGGRRGGGVVRGTPQRVWGVWGGVGGVGRGQPELRSPESKRVGNTVTLTCRAKMPRMGIAGSGKLHSAAASCTHARPPLRSAP
eukprot:349897-Chlamydomonas_euryale.AAC.3